MTGQFRNLILLLLATMLGMLLWFMAAAVLPDMAAEAGLGEDRLAWLSSIVPAGFGIGALIFALLGIPDRFDPRRVFAVCAGSAAIANAALLWVPIGGGFAIGLRFATGFLLAGTWPLSMKIAVGLSVRNRGFLMGTLVGALVAGQAAPYLLAYAGGADWRLALILGSGLTVLGAVAIMATSLGPHHAKAGSFRVSAIAAASFSQHMEPDAAIALGKLTAFFCILAATPACVWTGFLADRQGKAGVAAGALAVSGTAAILTALTFGGAVWLTMILLLIWGASVVPDSPQFSALVADHAPPELTGSLLTFQASLGFMMTTLTVQLAPVVAGSFGWPVLIVILALGPVFGLVVMRPLFGASFTVSRE